MARGWIVSLNADIGAVRWKFETPRPMVSGIVPMAGGVIFAADLPPIYAVRFGASGG